MASLDSIVNRHRTTLGRRKLNNSRTALRATTGARLLASGQAARAETAAVCTGTTVGHVRAAAILLKSEDGPLLEAVLRGETSLLKAARQARRVSRLVDAYRRASRDDLIGAAKILGGMIVPEHTAYCEAAE